MVSVVADKVESESKCVEAPNICRSIELREPLRSTVDEDVLVESDVEPVEELLVESEEEVLDSAVELLESEVEVLELLDVESDVEVESSDVVLESSEVVES